MASHVAYPVNPTDQDRQSKESEIDETNADEVNKGVHPSPNFIDERGKNAGNIKSQHERYEESAYRCRAMLAVCSSNYPADKQIQPTTNQKMGKTSPATFPKVANVCQAGCKEPIV